MYDNQVNSELMFTYIYWLLLLFIYLITRWWKFSSSNYYIELFTLFPVNVIYDKFRLLVPMIVNKKLYKMTFVLRLKRKREVVGE